MDRLRPVLVMRPLGRVADGVPDVSTSVSRQNMQSRRFPSHLCVRSCRKGQPTALVVLLHGSFGCSEILYLTKWSYFNLVQEFSHVFTFFTYLFSDFFYAHVFSDLICIYIIYIYVCIICIMFLFFYDFYAVCCLFDRLLRLFQPLTQCQRSNRTQLYP